MKKFLLICMGLLCMGGALAQNTELEGRLAKANKGDVDSQLWLGAFYMGQPETAERQKMGYEWYEKAAQKGNLEAIFHLGTCYLVGKGVDRDNERGIRELEKAAQAGYIPAMNALGKVYSNGKSTIYYSSQVKYIPDYQDPLNSIIRYECTIFGGFPLSYETQEGEADPEINPERALFWFQKASDAGDLYAMFCISELYRKGEIVEPDNHKAVAMLRRAAEAGLPVAQYNLSLVYKSDGMGVVEPDLKESLAWLTRSAENNYARATHALSQHYIRSSNFDLGARWALRTMQTSDPEYVSRDRKVLLTLLTNVITPNEGQNPEDLIQVSQETTDEVVEWLRSKAEAGDSEAQYDMAQIFYYHDKDYPKSRFWALKAAEQGDTNAQLLLFYLGKDEKKPTYNIAEAIQWLQRSAEGGNPTAQEYYGLCLYNGSGGVTINKALAYEYMIKSAEQGNVSAQYKAGIAICHDARSIRSKKERIPFWEKGVRLLEMAVAQNHLDATFQLALQHGYGTCGKIDLNKCRYYLRKAAQAGHAQAQEFCTKYYHVSY